MATIITRAGKGSALTFTEVDGNFTNLNNDGISNASSIATLQSDKFDKVGGTISGTTTVTGTFTTGGKVNSSTENNSQSGSTVTLTVPGSEIVRLTNNALVSISGVQAGSSGQKIILVNRTGTTVEIENESSSATAPNQIFTGTGGSLLLNSNASISLVYDSTTNRWNMIGGTGAGTGAGLINYIENSDASIGLTGYTTYDDGAAAPVDGSGGTPEAGLWVRSTTSPLRGSGDFNLVKTGGIDYQGNGVAYDFTIDRADLAKVLAVTFDYEVLSGTYATGDLTVYIIQDPTGTPVVIQPAGYQVQAATAGTTMKQIATFQTASNVTSYRLCIHVASPSTQDYSVALDNISVGPQIVQYGAPVTDWTAYTPTGSWVTNTTYAGYWRRVGDSIEVRARVSTSGAPTAASLTVSIPSGLSIDTTKAINSTITLGSLGIATINDGGVATYTGVVQYQSTTSVSVFVNNAASTYTLEADVTATVPFSFGATDKVDIFFSVPILGWGSTVQMSNDTDTRVVDLAINPTSAITPSGTISSSFASCTTINFNTTPNKDSHGIYNAGIITIPVAGDYYCAVKFEANATGGSFWEICYVINGTQAAENAIKPTANAQYLQGAVLLTNLKAGDLLTIRLRTDCTSPSIISSLVNSLSLFRLSGPSAIAASETVACEYKSSAGNSVANVTDSVFIDFATRSFDTHGAVVGAGSGNNTTATSTWRFVVPVSGKYHVTGSVGVAIPSATNYELFPSIWVNGVKRNTGTRIVANAWSTVPVSVSTTAVINVNAGDYISIGMYQQSGLARNMPVDSTVNYVSIVRVGN